MVFAMFDEHNVNVGTSNNTFSYSINPSKTSQHILRFSYHIPALMIRLDSHESFM
jgi:hypothetical protein